MGDAGPGDAGMVPLSVSMDLSLRCPDEDCAAKSLTAQLPDVRCSLDETRRETTGQRWWTISATDQDLTVEMLFNMSDPELTDRPREERPWLFEPTRVYVTITDGDVSWARPLLDRTCASCRACDHSEFVASEDGGAVEADVRCMGMTGLSAEGAPVAGTRDATNIVDAAQMFHFAAAGCHADN